MNTNNLPPQENERQQPAPVVDKPNTIEQFLKDRIKHAFESIESPGGPASQQYPFDEHTKEQMIGMKRAYSDVLTSLPELRQLHQQPTEWILVLNRYKSGMSEYFRMHDYRNMYLLWEQFVKEVEDGSKV